MKRMKSLYAMVVGLIALAAAGAAEARDEVFLKNGYAVSGYDVVSYFDGGDPKPGVDAHTHSYNGATYRFASQANRDRFAANPKAFAPAYGGFCALGTANGYKVSADPFAYTIVDGKLYLNYSKRVRSRWSTDIPGYIKGANNNWPLIKSIAISALDNANIPGLTLGPQ